MGQHPETQEERHELRFPVSFPRSAWECCLRRSASAFHPSLEEAAERPGRRSHAERENEIMGDAVVLTHNGQPLVAVRGVSGSVHRPFYVNVICPARKSI